MAIRNLIPWSRQESRLSMPVSVERDRDIDSHPLLSLHREVNQLFEDVFRGFNVSASRRFEQSVGWPRVELGESDKELRITAELPGLEEKDVEITVDDGVLTLRGEKRAQFEDRDRGYSERSYGRFERRIGLPKGVDHEQATATFKNGVVTITLPRTAAANENIRRIPINSAAAG